MKKWQKNFTAIGPAALILLVVGIFNPPILYGEFGWIIVISLGIWLGVGVGLTLRILHER